MYNPDDMSLPQSFHADSGLPPIQAMRRALDDQTDARDNQNPFSVTESEARQLMALTYGSISMIDDAIGRVMAMLDRSGKLDNTVVVFTTDHGDFMGDHGLMLKLLLHYQGLIRVPFIWADPQASEQGTRCSELASSIDISATILARAGIQAYNGLQGRDLLHDDAPESVLVEEDSQRTMTGFDRPQRVRTLVTSRYRMSLRQGEDWGELYDLETDPFEINNLYDNPEALGIRHQLNEQMLRRTIELQDTSPLPAYRA